WYPRSVLFTLEKRKVSRVIAARFEFHRQKEHAPCVRPAFPLPVAQSVSIASGGRPPQPARRQSLSSRHSGRRNEAGPPPLIVGAWICLEKPSRGCSNQRTHPLRRCLFLKFTRWLTLGNPPADEGAWVDLVR
ncbi:hypothetical protein AVEN_33362-1, partial [Araneus ventricosus]